MQALRAFKAGAVGYLMKNLLRTELVRQEASDGNLRDYHVGVQRKNAFSAALYFSSVPLSYVSIYASFFIFALIPALYFLPERKLAAE